MSILGYRAKRASILAVCLLSLLVVSGTIFIKGITPPSPTGTWAAAGNGLSLSSPRAGAAAVQLQDGRILITGGDDGSGAVATADIYDTLGNFSAAASMNVARSKHTATLLQDGTVLVAGGLNGGVATSSAEIYNPSNNTWAATGSLASARSGQTATALPDGTVLIAGGDNGGSPLSSLEIYDPANGTFSTVAGSLSSPREQHAAAALQSGDVLIVGGFNGSAALATTDIYSFSAGSVSPGPVMSTPRQGLTATTQLDGNVLIAGGNNGGNNGSQDLASAEVYSASAGTFSLTGSLATARQGHQAFLLPHNGSILIVGGTTPVSGVETATSSVEMYYPLASGTDANPNWNGTFNPTGAMASPRVSATGSPLSSGTPSSLNDGILLVAGGKDASGSALSSGELYGFAWVKTDALDYAPGTPVHITGGGWQPGETVTLHFQESPYFDTHPDLSAIADSNGNISHDQFSPDSHDIAIRFYLTATGSASLAQTTFTDAGSATSGDGTMTITTSPTNVIAGSTGNKLTFTFKGEANNGKNFDPSSIVTVTVPSGWSAPQNTNSSGAGFVSVSAGACNASLASISGSLITINQTCAGTSTFTFTYSDATAPTTAGTDTFTTASRDGGTGSPVDLTNGSPTVTVNAAAPASITATAGTPQSATINSAFTTNLAATVKDTFGNLVTGATVTFTPPGGGASGTFTGGNTANSNSSGVATANTLTANGTAGSYNVTASVSGVSTPASFSLTNNNPVPTITTLSPSSATVGAAAQTLTINGTNFVSSSTVTYNGVAHAATFVSSTQLKIQLSTSDQATTGTYPVIVTDPSPGGGNSNTVNFAVNNPAPTITSLSPPSVTAGAAAQTLAINGTNFVSASTVTYNGVSHAATFVSSTQLTILLTTSDQATAGTYPVIVTNPSPGGGTSNTVNFTVNNPTPTITSLSPTSATAGAAAQSLMINGTNFVSTSTVTYNGIAHAATFVSSTQLTIQLTTTDQATAGTYPVIVTNSTPGGGNSNTVNFTVNNPTPTISSLSPSSTTAGGGKRTLTINGTNFVSTSTVTYNGVSHAATFVSSTQLTIQLSANDQATAGTYPVIVTNSSPGGGTSNTVNFTVNNPVPTITTLSPASATAGAAAQTLSINGTNFVSTSTVTYNGVSHTATFVSSTQLTIQLTTADQATAGTYPVIVTNATPGGGTSNTVNFAVNNPAPTLTSISPTSGNLSQTLNVTFTGTNFISGVSSVSFAASGITVNSTTVNGSMQITANITIASNATVGAGNVSVTNSGPGGGTATLVNAFTVNNPATTTAVSSSLNPSPYGQPVTFTATVTSGGGTPTGTATFVAGNSCPETALTGSTSNPATLNGSGVATFTTSALPAGSNQTITACYNPTGIFTASNGSVSQTVNAATTSTSISAPTVVYPANGVVMVTVSSTAGTPTGNATLVVDGGSPLFAPLSSGTATFTLTSPGAGVHTLSASYAAQGNFAASGPTPGTLTVDLAPSITSNGSTTFNAAEADSFTVTTTGFPAPGLTETGALPNGVIFTDNGNGTATLAGTTTVAGSYPITITASNGVGTAAQQSFMLTVAAGSFTQLQILVPGETAAPGTTTGYTGSPNIEYVNGQFPVTVNATDANWNVVSTVTDTVHISSTDTSASLPSDAALSAGTGTFSVTPETVSNPATTTFTASDTTPPNNNLTATSQPIEVIVVYTAAITPTMVATGQATTYTLTISNAAAPNTNNLESATVAVPTADQGTISNVSVSATGATWTYDVSQLPGTMRFAANSSSDAVAPGGTITITYTATSSASVTSAPVQEVWNTVAFSGSQWTSPLPLAPPEPTVSVGVGPSFTSAASATFTYGSSGSFKVTTNGVPTNKLAESGTLPGGVIFTDNGDDTATITSTSTTPAGTYYFTITAHNGFGSDATQSFTLTVSGAALTITASSSSMTYGGTVPAITPSYSGFVAGDSASSLTTKPTCSTTATSSSPAGTYPSSCSGAVDSNYTITYVNGTVTVNPAALAITASSGSMTYGGPVFPVTPGFVGFVNGDTYKSLTTQPTCSTTATSFSPVLGSPYISSCSGAADSNYTITYVNGTVTVTPAALTISADNQSMTFGGTAPTFTATDTGLLGMDSPAVVSGLTFTVYTDNTLTTAVTDFSSLKAGSYPIVASNGSAANYSITYANGTLTVNKATFTGSVTISPVYPTTVPYGQQVTATVLLNSYSIGGVPVLQPHADPNNQNQQLPESLTVYLVPAGGGPSQAMKFGTATAVPAYDNTANTTGTTKTGWTATVTGKAPTPGNYTAFVYGDDPGDGSLTNLKLADSGYFYTDTSDIIYPTLQSGQLDVVPAALSITANSTSKTYGQTVTFAGTEFTTSGLVNSDTVTSVTLTSAGAAPTATVAGSPYSIVPSAAVGSGLSNYTITYLNGKLTVNPATLTLKVVGATGPYTAYPFPATCSVASGLVNNDSVTLTVTYAPGVTAPVNVGSYTATCTSSGNSNYQTATGQASIVITPAPLTISADNQSMTFGGTAPTFTATYTGLLGMDTSAVVSGLVFTVYTDNTFTTAVTDFSSLKAGSYPIVATNGSAANYSITYANGTLTVNKATFTGSVTISPVDPTTVPYGQPVTATVLLNTYSIGGVPVLQPHADPNNPNQQLPESLTVYLVPVGGGPSQAMKFGTATAVPAYDNTANITGTTKTGWTATITGKAPTPGNYVAEVYGDDPGDGSLTNLKLADSGYFYTDTSDIIYPTLQSGQLDVVPAALSITANSTSKTYGQTVTFAGTEFTTSGLVNSDTVTSVTLTSAGAAPTATVAGSPYSIVPSAAVGSGLSNYTITYVNGSLTVNKATPAFSNLTAPLTIAYGAASITVSGNLTAPTATPPNADTVTVSIKGTAVSQTFALNNGAFTGTLNTATVPASTTPYAICYSFAGDSNFNAASNNTSTTLTVQKATPAFSNLTAPLTIAYGAASITVSGNLTAPTATPPNADTVTVSIKGTTVSQTFALNNGAFTGTLNTATVPASATPYAICYSFAGDSNFNAASDNTSTTLTVQKATPVFSNLSSPLSILYGMASITVSGKLTAPTAAPPNADSVTVSINGTSATQTVALNSGAFTATLTTAMNNGAIAASVTPYAISYSFAGDSNFNAASNNSSTTLTVNPAPLMITASSSAMIYGGPVPPISPSYSGFVNGDMAASLTTQAACGATATSASPVGTYASNCSGAVDPNYMPSYVPGTVTVNQATTTLAVTSSTSGASIFLQPVTFTATVSPQFTGVPGGTVTFYDAGSNASPTCASPGTQIGTPQPLNLVPGADSASVTTATLSGTTHTILACSSGDSNFLPGSGTVTQTVTPAPVVTVAPGSISFTGQTVNTTSSPMNVTLTNIGDASLSISPASFVNSTVAGEFAIYSNNCGATLGYPGESGNPPTSCTIAVTFTPKDTGESSATLQITDNNDDISGSQQNVTLEGGGLSTISAGGTLYTDAVFATGSTCGTIVLSGGSTIDSFNSLNGFSSSHQLSGANVGTNGNITLGGKSAIYGSASVMSTTSGNCSKTSITGLTTNGGAQVSGGLNQLGGVVSYPAPPIPNPAPPTTSVNVSHSCPSGMNGCANTGSNTVTLAPGSYGNVQFSGGTAAYLNTGTYNFNSLTLSGKSILYVGSGPVIINIAGAGLSGNNPAFDVSGGSIVNTTGIPSNLQLYYGGSRGVNLSGGSQASGTVYAPAAPVTMSGGTDWFGGIIGGSISDSGGTTIHYDTNLTNVAAGDTLWLTAVINNLNVNGKPVLSKAPQIKLYLTNSTVSFAAANAGQCAGAGETYNSGTCTVAVPNAVVTLNSASATSPKTSYDLTNNRWVTSVPPSNLTGNTFVAGVAIPVPAGLPAGLQNVSWSTAFSTDTSGITFQWQWSAGVYKTAFNSCYAYQNTNSSNPCYNATSNSNLLGVNPEDGSADINGTDPAGTPETSTYKNNEVIGFFSAASGVAAAAAEMSTSPSSYAFMSPGQATVSVLTNNDGVTHNISGFSITGTNAADFALQPTSSGMPNSCVGITSLAAGASCNLYVVYTKTASVAESARIVANDDANNTPQSVYMTGP